MITGIGVDILELDKIGQYSKKRYFIDNVFTKKEIDYIQGNLGHMATTFAAKEAIFKALKTGWLDPQEIEIRRNKKGSPKAIISGNLKKILKNRRVMINLSFSKNYAVAFAIIQE